MFQKTLLIAAALVVPVLLGAGAALAQNTAAMKDGWLPYESVSGSFSVMMPPTREETSTQLRVSDKIVLYSTELSSAIDSRPFKNMVKRYIVKSDQTLGAPLAPAEINEVLERETQNYIEFYKTMGGTVRDKQEAVFLGYPGNELVIDFNDPEFGPQGIRVLILMSSVTKIQQIVIGPGDTLFAFRTKDFFKSLKLNEGYTRENGTMGDGWHPYTSPTEIFTVLLPEVKAPFVLAEPEMHRSEKTEMIAQKIYDPVWGQYIFYNIYGYRFDRSMTYTDAQQVMTRNHLMKYGIDIRQLIFTRGENGENATLEVALVIPAPEEAPYANYVHLRATFLGNYMAVQEVITSYPIGKGEFTASLLSLLEFHPRRAHDLMTGAIPPSAPAPVPAPEATPAAAAP